MRRTQTLDSEIQKIADRTIRQIARAKIQEPKGGQTIQPCHWSKTGYAIANADGSCTCKPARKPK